MPPVRLILAVVVAGVVGTVANSVIVAALTPNEFIPLAVSPAATRSRSRSPRCCSGSTP